MAARTLTIFDSTTSPQLGGDSVGIGDGTGAWLRVVPKKEAPGRGVDITDELIHFVLTGATLATIKILTMNETSSPQVSATLQHLKDAGTMVDVSYTAEGSFSITLPSGVYFTAIISGSGSPLPATVLTAHGEIETA